MNMIAIGVSILIDHDQCDNERVMIKIMLL